MFLLNTIQNMDNIFGCKQLPDSFVDLTVTSPPYDNLREYNGFLFEFFGLAKELFRVTKDGGVLVWIVNDATIKGSETLTSFKQALYFKEIGFNVHDTMIWQKDCIPQSHNRYEPSFEYMFVFSKGKPKTFNPLLKENTKFGKKITGANARTEEKSARQGIQKAAGKVSYKENSFRKNIWYFPVGFGSSTSDKIAFEHPAIFPERLAADHIKSWSNPNEIILDPFMGSGTVAKVARELGRNYIGFEISKEYCDIAQKRLEQTKNIFNY